MGRDRNSLALSTVAGLLSLIGSSDAFWRMPCRSRTGLMRIDPIMDYGGISDHVHTLHGAGSESRSSNICQ